MTDYFRPARTVADTLSKRSTIDQGVYVVEANEEVFSIHRTLEEACRAAALQGLDVRFMEWGATARSKILNRVMPREG